MKLFLPQLALLSALMLSGCRSTSNLTVVENFEIERYLGRWYEAARFPHGFEQGLTSVTADYSLNPDGSIKVLNRGYNPEKREWDEALGKARFKNDPSQGWLKVSFFGPFYASYKILYLDVDYTEALVAGPNYDYLWILVRDPDISTDAVDRLAGKAALLGFDTNRLERIDQSMN